MEETIFSMGELSMDEMSNGDQADNAEPPATTKVYYYLDDSPTPYVSIIASPANSVTLSDFRRVFTNKGYKYFCKELDKDIGCEVKVEITDDRSRLRKSANGLYELFLLPIPGAGTLTRNSGTLPRKAPKTSGAYVGLEFSQKPRRRRSLDGLDDSSAFNLPPSVSASSRGTVISRRAGEHLAEYTSNSEDHYRFDDSNSRVSLTESSMYDTVAVRPGEARRKRKPRKDRYRKAYVPSTISSVTESSMTSLSLPQIVEIHLALNASKYLGISVVSIDGSILVSDIMPDGAVAVDGRIEVGDQIVSVNNTSFEDLSDAQSVQLLREVAAAKRPLTLFVAKRSRNFEHKQETLTSLGADATMPLDISLWVQTAVQCNEQRYRTGFAPDEQSEITFEEGTMGPSGETDDEEEERLYMERRNGIPLPRTVQDEAERRRENERNEQLHPIYPSCVSEVASTRLSIRLDPAIIVCAMAKPNSGLQVKNRKWLKILVPMSFIGRELVDWLLEHVEDIPDRKVARNYAAQLLNRKLIRHVVSKLTFTEKCYYVFEESIVGRMGADSTQTSAGTMRAEATTEVTYLGSPGPAGHVRGRAPTQAGGFPDQTHQTWPISPITVFNSTRMNGRRRDCESPVTNDYASMVGVDSVIVGVHPRGIPPPNTPLCGSTMLNPPHPSPCETEFEDDDRRRMLKN